MFKKKNDSEWGKVLQRSQKMCVWISSHPICLLLPQRFVFPTRRKTKSSLVYFWKCSKEFVRLVTHSIVRRYDVKKILDDANCEINSLRVCREVNPRMSNPFWRNWHDGTYLVPTVVPCITNPREKAKRTFR